MGCFNLRMHKIVYILRRLFLRFVKVLKARSDILIMSPYFMRYCNYFSRYFLVKILIANFNLSLFLNIINLEKGDKNFIHCNSLRHSLLYNRTTRMSIVTAESRVLT